MGKKAKVYKPGDFVFAKVKGYPAWPAKVVSLNGKKYGIYFYGTGESGSLPANDLFDYFDHKQKFAEKVLKRRDYNEGLLQIESETQELGVTSNDNKLEITLDTTVENDNTTIETSIASDLDQTAADVSIPEASVSTPDVAKIPKKRAADTPNSATQPPAKSRKISEVDVKESENRDNDDTNQIVQEETVVTEKEPENVEKEIEIPEESNVAEAPAIEEIVKTPTGRGRKPNKIPQSPAIKTPRKVVKQEVMSPVYEPHIPVVESVSRSGRKIKPKRYLDEEAADVQSAQQTPVKKIKIQPITPAAPQLMTPEEEDNIVTSLATESSPVNANISLAAPVSEVAVKRGRKKIIKPNKTFQLIPQNELEKYLYQIFTEEEASDQPKVLPAVLPKGEVVGIKCPKEWPDFNSQKTKQDWVSATLLNITRMKEELENGLILPSAIPNQLETELNLSASEIDMLKKNKENEKRKRTLQILRIEHRFLELDKGIRLALNNDSADTEKSIQLLDELIELQITKLMLLKNPKTVYLIKSLKRYVGNIEHWKLSDEEVEDFKKKAVIINEKAECCFDKMKILFDVKDNESFATQFSEQLVILNVLSESMKPSDLTELVDEPIELSQNNFNMPSDEIKNKIKELKEKQISKVKTDAKTVS